MDVLIRHPPLLKNQRGMLVWKTEEGLKYCILNWDGQNKLRVLITGLCCDRYSECADLRGKGQKIRKALGVGRSQRSEEAV